MDREEMGVNEIEWNGQTGDKSEGNGVGTEEMGENRMKWIERRWESIEWSGLRGDGSK